MISALILGHAGIRQFIPFLDKVHMLRTCFPFPSFDIHNHSPVLFSKVLQDDHIMGLIGIIHINTAGPHTKDLKHERETEKATQ